MAAEAPGLPGRWLYPLPYILTGVLPFWAGMLLAQVSGFPLGPGIWVTGTLGVLALILAAFASREAFSPGVGQCPSLGGLPPHAARRLSFACLALVALLGLILQFGWGTGDLTLPLGWLGVLGGYCYFAPPICWHRRAWGEAVGGLCLGLLPVTAGFYLSGGHLVSEVLLYGLPLTFGAFNLFLVHGFPGPEAGVPLARHSLAQRLRPVTGAFIYTLCNVLIMVGLGFCLFFPAYPLPLRGALWPLLLLATVNQELIKRKAYRHEARLRLLCWLTLALHLGLGLTFNLMLWQRL
jgi:1,4-dihydroxy-2-naphthoate octaprenyltransferase